MLCFFLHVQLLPLCKIETAQKLIPSLIDLPKLGRFNFKKFVLNFSVLWMKQKSTKISANYIKENLTTPFILKSNLHVLGLKQDHVTICWL